MSPAWIGGAATIPVTNPADDSVIGHVPKLGAAETRRAIEAAEKAQKPWAQEDRQGARRHLAQMVRPDDGEPGGSRADHDRRAGQAACRIARRDRLWRLVRRVLRRRGQAHLWRDDPLALADVAHGGDQAAGRRRRGDHAVELPQRDDHPQGRTRRSRPAAPSSASRPAETPLSALALAELGERAGIPPGVFSVLTGSAREIGAEMTSNPIVRGADLHRLHRGRARADGAMRADDQEARPRTRRQRAVHRVRRRRSRRGGARARWRPSTATPARPASAPIGSWCRTASTTRFAAKLAEAVKALKVGRRRSKRA